MRRDLHALLDADQMAFEPISRLVVFSEEAQEWPEYRAWHRSAKLSTPQPGFEAQAPSLSALKKRWSAFVKAQKR